MPTASQSRYSWRLAWLAASTALTGTSLFSRRPPSNDPLNYSREVVVANELSSTWGYSRSRRRGSDASTKRTLHEQNKERRLARVSNYNRSPVPCDDIAAIVTCRCSEFTIGYVSSLNICLSFLYSLPVLHICFFVLRIILMADFMILKMTLARERFNETLWFFRENFWYVNYI